jgi:ferrous iron transport protein B
MAALATPASASSDPMAVELSSDSTLTQPAKQTVVLAGNPNVGKSVFFNAYSGRYANVSNFPGTTVDIPKATLPDGTLLMDSPGVYGLSGMSEEEQVAERAALQADVIINVVCATTLTRDLFLTQQLIDMGKPMVVALNQMDDATARGLVIDLPKLEALLGVPVLPTVATANQGLDAVKARWQLAQVGNPTPDMPPADQVAALEKDPGQRMLMYGQRRHHINAIVSQVFQQTDNTAKTFGKWAADAIGQWLLNPWIGLLVAVGVLISLYQVIGVWVAGDLVGLTEETIMLGYVIPAIQQVLDQFIPHSSPLAGILGGEFGTLTMSVQYIFGVLFPLVLGFYVYISILEDCGYLPRLAVLCDGALSKIGLNGRAVIPLILGLGCVTMATVATRVLTSQRERTIASTILAITIPCSAQIGVIMGLIALAGGLKAWLSFVAILGVILAVLGTALDRLLPGKSSSLVMALPPLRRPQLKNVAIKTWMRTKSFLFEAAPLFVLGSLLVAVLQTFGWLESIQLWLMPLTKTWLHLPAETARAFVMGMVRRDFGAAGLYMMADHISPNQILTSLIVITLFVPCIASAAVIWKERGAIETTTVVLGSWGLAFAIGGLVARIL